MGKALDLDVSPGGSVGPMEDVPGQVRPRLHPAWIGRVQRRRFWIPCACDNLNPEFR